MDRELSVGVDADPGREAWLRERRTGLGSSDAAAVAGLNPYVTPWHVYQSKVGELPDRDSGPKKWGRKLEEVVAEAYREQTGRQVCPPTERLLRHPSLPWMLASLDRMTVVDGVPRALEIKTAARRVEGDGWGEPGTDEVPVHYYIQCQHQLAVTGWAACDLAVLFGGQNLEVYELPRNEKIIDALERTLTDFWGMVERREEPDPNWEHPATLEVLQHLYGVDEGLAVDLGEEDGRTTHLYLYAKERLKEAQQEVDSLKARLLHAMGPAGCARLADGHTLFRKTVRRKAYSVPESEYVRFTVKAPKNRG